MSALPPKADIAGPVGSALGRGRRQYRVTHRNPPPEKTCNLLQSLGGELKLAPPTHSIAITSWSPEPVLSVLAGKRVHNEKSASARAARLLAWQSRFPVREWSRSTQHHAVEVPHGVVLERSSAACGDAASFSPLRHAAQATDLGRTVA